ncbi:MAG: (d)CMP kinase, partial [Clostridia bacterium]|nr:(d)CMP kinase [Clostridia bacterium]
MINIALDGPSGAGKSTLAKALAAKLGYIYTDTGAMYRTIGLAAKRAGISPENKEEVIALLPSVKISLGFENGEQKIYLSGEDVGGLIRTNEISAYASKVSAIPEVRSHLLALQRNIAAENNVIMDGRDIGTVILPNADVKFFVTVSDRERARRRYMELIAKGENTTEEEVYEAMKAR